MELDEIDYKILEVLQKDGRISNQDLADRVGLSPSPCLRRVRALENRGIVRRYVALLDAVAVGCGLRAIVEIRLDRQRNAIAHRFEKEILKHPQVLECYQLAGDWDYALCVAVRDLDAFREFCVNTLSKLAGVGNVNSNITMKQVKYSTAFLLDKR